MANTLPFKLCTTITQDALCVRFTFTQHGLIILGYYHSNAEIYFKLFSAIKCTVNSTVSGHRQFRVTFAQTFLFFHNVKVYRLINYPVIFPNLLATWNLLLVVKFWFTDVVITKRLTAPLPWKVKIPVKCLHPTS